MSQFLGRDMLNKFISSLFYIVNLITPKLKNKTVFCCFPDFEDMLRGMLPHINGRIIVLVTNTDVIRPNWLDEKIEVVKKKSISGLWHLLTARTIYFTHGLFVFFRVIPSKRQLVINLWHGMALKNIGLLDGKANIPQSHKTICTSSFFQKIHAKAFGMKLEDVLISGLPRNDILNQETTNINLVEIKKNYNKCYVWLPTYRKASKGDVRSDGTASSIFSFDDFDYIKLNTILAQKNELLFIKPHPMAVFDDFHIELSNVKIINEAWLSDKDTTLYELLSISDALWTDYSSVFVDYLVTDKPILFIMPDFYSYKGKRGFTFEIEDEKLPGYTITEQDSLFDKLKVGFQNDSGLSRKKFNTYSKFNYNVLLSLTTEVKSK